MGRKWWTVWIKVAILAVVLLLAYNFAKGLVVGLFDPYLLDTSVAETAEPEEGDLVGQLVGKVENAFDVRIDYENMIFDYANEFAQGMMDQSVEERNVIQDYLE